MTAPVTTEQAVQFWAAEADRMAYLRDNLQVLLPSAGTGHRPVSEASIAEIEECLADALLAAETILGGYARALHAERTALAPRDRYSRAAGY